MSGATVTAGLHRTNAECIILIAESKCASAAAEPARTGFGCSTLHLPILSEFVS
jgi:hypothetical protein